MQKSFIPHREFLAGEQMARLNGKGCSVSHEQLFALLVSSENEWRGNLEEFFRAHQMTFDNARSFEELANALCQTHPEVIVTAANLPDGTWRDIASLIEKLPEPTGLVVAERHDRRPYLSAAIDCGAFDFIHSPFVSETQACIIQVAARETRRKRKARASHTRATLT